MSTSRSSPFISIGNKSINGKATVSIEVVMTETEQKALLERITSGETPLNDRDGTVEALGIVPEEG